MSDIEKFSYLKGNVGGDGTNTVEFFRTTLPLTKFRYLPDELQSLLLLSEDCDRVLDLV